MREGDFTIDYTKPKSIQVLQAKLWNELVIAVVDYQAVFVYDVFEDIGCIQTLEFEADPISIVPMDGKIAITN